MDQNKNTAAVNAKAEEAKRIAEAKAAKAAAKAAKEAEKLAAKAAKEAEKAEKAAAKEAAKAPRLSQNGQPLPAPGTISSRLWAFFDAKSTELGRPTKLSEVIEAVVADGIKESSARAGYAHWRKFYGLTKVAAEVQPQQAAA